MKNITDKITELVIKRFNSELNEAEEKELQEWISHISLKRKDSNFPLLYYYAGYFNLKSGLREKASTYFDLAAKQPGDYCFPYRVEEIKILETALTKKQNDSKGYYYLGNLYYYLRQFKKAIPAWEKSIQIDNSFYLAHRKPWFRL